jgi:hypothetical protein
VRFYRIQITDPTTGKDVIPSSLGGLGITSVLPNGQINPAALNVEFDLPIAPYHTPAGGCWVRIWGLGLKDIGSAFDLNGALISVFAGMSKGLPLANPAQARLLVKGQIFQSYGNWVGTDMTVDLLLAPATGSNDDPKNFVIDWRAGMTLATALSSTLATALPTAKQTINISPRLVQSHDSAGYYATLAQLASVLNRISTSIIKDANYPGVVINYNGDTVTVTDLTGPQNPAKAIAFQDLIGQPTWIGPQTIQAKLVLRGDINPMDTVTLPRGLATSTAATLARFQDRTTFSSDYAVQSVHHFCNFRQSDAASFNTTLELFPLPKAA